MARLLFVARMLCCVLLISFEARADLMDLASRGEMKEEKPQHGVLLVFDGIGPWWSLSESIEAQITSLLITMDEGPVDFKSIPVPNNPEVRDHFTRRSELTASHLSDWAEYDKRAMVLWVSDLPKKGAALPGWPMPPEAVWLGGIAGAARRGHTHLYVVAAGAQSHRNVLEGIAGRGSKGSAYPRFSYIDTMRELPLVVQSFVCGRKRLHCDTSQKQVVSGASDVDIETTVSVPGLEVVAFCSGDTKSDIRLYGPDRLEYQPRHLRDGVAHFSVPWPIPGTWRVQAQCEAPLFEVVSWEAEFPWSGVSVAMQPPIVDPKHHNEWLYEAHVLSGDPSTVKPMLVDIEGIGEIPLGKRSSQTYIAKAERGAFHMAPRMRWVPMVHDAPKPAPVIVEQPHEIAARLAKAQEDVLGEMTRKAVRVFFLMILILVVGTGVMKLRRNQIVANALLAAERGDLDPEEEAMLTQAKAKEMADKIASENSEDGLDMLGEKKE